jgi:hypothetical protein
MTVMDTTVSRGVRDLCPYQGIRTVDAGLPRGICPD